MIRNRLRIYYGPEDDAHSPTVAQEPQQRDSVTVTAGEIFGILADAAQGNRTWLKDFEDDDVTISSDLYEVIIAYQHMRRPSA